MKIAVLNDTHCGVRNSSDIFLNYQDRFYNEVFFPYLKEHGITQILHLGDYYDHRKYVNFKALNQNRKSFLERMRDDGISMDIIPGPVILDMVGESIRLSCCAAVASRFSPWASMAQSSCSNWYLADRKRGCYASVFSQQSPFMLKHTFKI